jgi:hypothetical protein
MLEKRGMLCALALAAALGGAGCGPQAKNDSGTPPVEQQPVAVAHSVRHAQLEAVEEKIQAALGAATPNYGEVFSGATDVAKGAEDILGDEPTSLAEADRLRYEGLVSALKEKAANLQAAAEQQQAFQARRSFSQLTATCVKCHGQFGPGETH